MVEFNQTRRSGEKRAWTGRQRLFVILAGVVAGTMHIGLHGLARAAEAISPDGSTKAGAETSGQAGSQSVKGESQTVKAEPEMTMEQFLDRLRAAESGGDNNARNPKSTAVGPYQFIEATWLDVMRRHFAADTEGLDGAKLLALRTDAKMARRAVEIFTKENAAYLLANGVAASFPNLRLAHLVGPVGAVRVLKADPDARALSLLGPGVGRANPFMLGMTARALIERSARDLRLRPSSVAGVAAGDIPKGAAAARKPKEPQIAVACDLSLASCRRWLALAKARLRAGGRKSARSASAD